MKRLPFVLALLGVACTALAGGGASDVRYSVTPIAHGTSSISLQVEDLNNKGEVVGVIRVTQPRAFYWRRGRLEDIADAISPGAVFTSAVAINDRSQIIAHFRDPAYRDGAVLLDRGRVVPLPGRFEVPIDINIHGQVLGQGITTSGTPRSVLLWERGRITEFPLLSQESYQFATALNNRGVAAGQALTPDGYRAVLWQRPYIDVTVLQTLPGELDTRPLDVNERGQVIGYTIVDGFSRGFLWENGAAIELPVLYSNQHHSQANEINNSGLVVGKTTDTNGVSVATLWRRGVPRNLNDLIRKGDPLKSSVKLIAAEQVNDRGQIAAVTHDDPNDPSTYRWYLLTPSRQ